MQRLMASKIVWLLLVMLLSISTFGLWMCCFFILSAFSTFIGFAVMLYSTHQLKISENPLNRNNCEFYRRCDNFSFSGITKVVEEMNIPAKLPKYDQRLTGSNEIDGPLREIILFITRDFIHSWYKDVSSNEDFVINFNEMCKKIINTFSQSSKEVNWVSFLSRKLVEDFTSHLRLYRHTEMLFRRTQKEKLEVYPTIESLFFELEANMEKVICRENACTLDENEQEYLQCLSDIILYLLLPPEDFNNRILKKFLREVLASSILKPIIDQFSDPDIINQHIVWMCKDYPVSSKSLLNVLRRSDNMDELSAFIQIAKHELKVQKSKDTGDKDEMKKYIKSILYVENVANQRYGRLQGHSKQAETDSLEFFVDLKYTDTTDSKTNKLVSLPFDVILNNNVALHYFTEYLTSMDAESYVYFYHNVEAFRATAEMLHSDGILQESIKSASEKLKNYAFQIYDTYLGNHATANDELDEVILKKLLSRLKVEEITETCFDEAQEKVHEILENEFYLTGFKDSKEYVKLLAELDLLHDMSTSSDDIDSLSSNKSEEEEKFNCDTVVPTDEEMLSEFLSSEISSEYEFPEISSGVELSETKQIGNLFAEVHSTGITHHAGRTFAVYAISVSHKKLEGTEEKWFVVRRYSEFYEFHETLLEKYPHLSTFNFPPKKPFNNLSRQLMEKRRTMLNDFIQFLLSPDILASCDDLKLMLYNFLQPNVSEKGKSSFIRTVGNIVNPIKSSVRTMGNIVKLVPDTLFELKDGLVKALFKSSEENSSYYINEAKVLPFKDPDADDIPFRIILLLMDEIFNLRNKDLWFRRRIMALLRQIIKTMQGGAINRKIKDYVQGMTSATQIAEWLKLLSKTIWPNGILAKSPQERDYNTKMRTRTVTKLLLLCAIPDELKHIIGYETSFKGAMLIFNMFQHPSLNRRLLFVLFESFLITLFPENKLSELFKKLHSQSSRLVSVKRASIDSNEKDQQLIWDVQKSQTSKIKNTKSKENTKTHNEAKNRLGLQCLSHQDSLTIPKENKKRKKSIETAVFYADLSDNETEEDSVILPLLKS